MSAAALRVGGRGTRIAIAAGILVGVAIRIALSFAAEGKSWSDSAIIALMAMHALSGHFYTFYWGQSYMGSIESLGVAPFFAIFGVRDATLSMGLLPWYVLFAIALAVLARRMAGPLAAVAAVWLLAFAPPYVQYQQIMPRGDYPETLAFGTILLCLTLSVTHDALSEGRERRALLAIGFVAGLAFWTNWLVFPYFAVVGLYLLLHDWRLLLRPVMAAILAAFFLGSLPFWIYNVRHGFPTFSFVADVQTAEGRRIALEYAVGGAIPVLLGFRDLDGRFTWGWPGAALTLVAAGATLALFVGLRRSWSALIRARVRETHPAVALLLLAVAMVAIYSVGLPGRFHVPRYMLPLVTATLALLAAGLAWVAERSRPVAAVAIAGLLVFYAIQIVDLGRGLAKPGERPGVTGPVTKLADHLQNAGIRYGYADYGDATLTTYLTRERVILTDYFGARYPLEEVDFHDPAIVVRGDTPQADGTLASLNAIVTTKRIPGYAIHWPVRYDGVPRAPLARSGWTVTASDNGARAADMLDGDRWTYWSVPADKRGAAVTLDLGKVEAVSGLHFDLGARGNDGFAALRVESSVDGERWSLIKNAEWEFPLFFEPSGQITTVPSDSQSVLFDPRPARWLRLTLVRNFTKYDWSIGELSVFGPGGSDVTFRTPQFADPTSPELTERRLRLQSTREPENDEPLVELRRLYRSLGRLDEAHEVEKLEAERFRPTTAAGFRYGRDLKLLGWDWRGLGERRVEITYFWQAMRSMDQEYAAAVHFKGGLRGLQDDHVLVGPRTTRQWRRDEIVKDPRTITIPAGVADGAYPVEIGVWVPSRKRHVRLGPLGLWGPKARKVFALEVRGDDVAVRALR